jgi:hypothetical protein
MGSAAWSELVKLVALLANFRAKFLSGEEGTLKVLFTITIVLMTKNIRHIHIKD